MTDAATTTASVQPAPADLPSQTAIGKIERVPLRKVWKHEAHNLTTWLEENVDVLTDVLGVELSNVEREHAAGKFNVDLVAEDDSGGIAVVENQLEKSDHDHLGKLITYTAFMEARVAIWIVADPRPEHVRAISWLNESSPADFFLVKIEGIRIGNSPPAPLLTLIVGPSEESREVGEAKKDRAERYHIRRQFWTGLLEMAKQRTKLHAGVSPGEYGWVGASAGKRGLNLNYVVTQHGSSVELYIDRGRDAAEENVQIFDALHAHKDEIEAAFGGPLSWERLETKRASRLAYRLQTGGWRDDSSKWSEVYEQLVHGMIRLEKALRPFLKELPV